MNLDKFRIREYKVDGITMFQLEEQSFFGKWKPMLIEEGGYEIYKVPMYPTLTLKESIQAFEREHGPINEKPVVEEFVRYHSLKDVE